MNMFTIHMPLNPKLDAHNKGHWKSKVKPVRDAKATARLLALATGCKPLVGHIVVDYAFTVPDRRRRDTANMIHSCKAIVDGVVDSKLISGDHWDVLSIGAVSVTVGTELAVDLTFRTYVTVAASAPELFALLRDLYDLQTVPPMSKHGKKWLVVMEKIEQLAHRETFND